MLLLPLYSLIIKEWFCICKYLGQSVCWYVHLIAKSITKKVLYRYRLLGNKKSRKTSVVFLHWWLESWSVTNSFNHLREKKKCVKWDIFKLNPRHWHSLMTSPHASSHYSSALNPAQKIESESELWKSNI